MKLKLKKGDNAQVMRGKDRDKHGKIIAVQPDFNRVKIEGLNKVKRHMKKSTNRPLGGIVEKENWIDASNVMLLDPQKNVPTRVGRQIKIAPDGTRKLVRYAKKSGAILD